jgi:hypothetical protein
MSSRLRSLDSKISFFAFADIITAVSGVLIFVALLLATDLGRPTASHSQTTSATERQLQESLARQVEVDAQNQRLEELLATAATSPDPAKLQADLTSLRAQLAQEQRKQNVLTDEMAASQAALAARDQALGLTDLNAAVTRLLEQVAVITSQDSAAHKKMDELQGQVAHAESQLLKLHQRQNQIWVIPERSLTTKEPVLVTVAGTGVTIDRFDRPDQRQELSGPGLDADFISYLHHARTNDQYMVFLIKPSGIQNFSDLVQSARDLGFDVGYDALEENRVVHFGTPPPLDATAAPPEESSGLPRPRVGSAAGGRGTAGSSAAGGGGGAVTSGQGSASESAAHTNHPPVTPPASAAQPPPAKSWWQRLLEWLGFK